MYFVCALKVSIAVLGAAIISLAKPNDTSEDLRRRLELSGAGDVVVEENNSGKAREGTHNLRVNNECYEHCTQIPTRKSDTFCQWKYPVLNLTKNTTFPENVVFMQ
ncbi:uncharacterized protein LOC143240374 [Tachypleus tridentatus]|uniref:uncharacterized protein LOC143240374 n=1 Tax=Tachypleus tridentatus TaxID=6853 RepID=UPI003FD37738